MTVFLRNIRRNGIYFILFTLAVLSIIVTARADMPVQGEKPLADAAQEQRARNLFRELRCEVCEGQSVADSNATLASDMRGLVRDKVASGESNEAILFFFAERYGDDILMHPPVKTHTMPLWFAPAFILILGAWFAMRYFSRRQASHF